MHCKFKLILTLFFLLLSIVARGQNSSSTKMDTVIIYETMVVYDTVYIHDTIRENGFSGFESIGSLEPKQIELKILQLDTTDNIANLLIISKNRTATIPINGIILNENINNSKSMKKLSFFGVMAFAFQSMVLAQADFGITTGGGTWWAKCNEPIVNSEYSTAYKAGLFFKYRFSNNLFLGLETNYHYLTSNYSYKAIIDTANLILAGERESATSYHQFSIPLHIGYNIGKFGPYVGLEYSYRMAEKWLNKSFSSYGFQAGLNYNLNEKLSLGINYYYGLSKDYQYKGDIVEFITEPWGYYTQSIGNYSYNWKSSRIELSVYYNFRKVNKEKSILGEI